MSCKKKYKIPTPNKYLNDILNHYLKIKEKKY